MVYQILMDNRYFPDTAISQTYSQHMKGLDFDGPSKKKTSGPKVPGVGARDNASSREP